MRRAYANAIRVDVCDIATSYEEWKGKNKTEKWNGYLSDT